jgi:PPP family 3-phenylpropionic acid transporter
MNPLWGHLADTRFGRRTILRVGATGAGALAIALFAADGGFPTVAVASALFAGFAGTMGPNADAIALEMLGEERMHRYGFIRAWESLSYALMTLLLGLWLSEVGVDKTLLAFAVMALATLAWSFALQRDEPTRSEGHGRLGAVGTVLRESARYRAFLAASLLIWTGFAAAWNFIALRIEDSGGGLRTIGFGLALGGAVEVPVMLGSSRMAARFGLRFVYLAGGVVYATGFLIWGLIESPVLLSLTAVFEGVGFGLLFTSGVAIVGRLVRPALHSTGLSISGTVGFGMGQILGSLLGGFLYGRYGSVTVYVAASGLAFAGAALAAFALDTPLLRRPQEIDVGALPPHGSEAG